MSGPAPVGGPFYDALVLARDGASERYEDLFAPNSTYPFASEMTTAFPNDPDRLVSQHQYLKNVDRFNSDLARYQKARAQLANTAFETLNRYNFLQLKSRLVDDPDLAQFVYLLEDGSFAVKKDNARELGWFRGYLQRVYSAWDARNPKPADLRPTVVLRPIILDPDSRTCAYYVCPVDVTTRENLWRKCGFDVPPLGFYPLDISSPDDFLVRYQDTITAAFRLPRELATFDARVLARFWAMQANSVNNPIPKKPVLAVPQQQFNFDGVSGGSVTIMTGSDASSVITTPAPLPFPDPFAPENLRGKFIATGDPSYFGDKSVFEQKDKLIAAIGTAAAAAITIGIAKVYA